MVFESVFGSLSGVQEVIVSGRVAGSDIIVNVDKTSIGVFLTDSDQYFESYTSDAYFMSPGGEYEKQCLYYGTFGRIEEVVVELLDSFLGGECSVNYRGKEDMSGLLSE